MAGRAICMRARDSGRRHLSPAEKEEWIAEMKRILKPGGRVVIADLMFENTTEEGYIKQALRESGGSDIVEDVEDEYYGLFDDLGCSFGREGFAFRGEQLTPLGWILRACLPENPRRRADMSGNHIEPGLAASPGASHTPPATTPEAKSA